MRVLALALLAACGTDVAPVEQAVFGLDVRTRLEVDDKGKRELVVVVSGPSEPGWTLEVPDVAKVTFGEPSEREERIGDTRVLTWRYPFRASRGSYIIEGVCADPVGDDPPVCAAPLYIDIDTEMDRSAMVDIVEPDALWPLPSWQVVLGSLVTFSLIGAGLLVALRSRQEVVVTEVAEEPPHLLALRRWDAIRSDADLDDFEKAQWLSEVFRVYVGAALQFPATAYTTTETLAHLDSLAALPRENIPRARRLLRATDRVKYAEAKPGADFFDDLDSDLRAFIDSTRPKTWERT
jgi:hypothetical protein